MNRMTFTKEELVCTDSNYLHRGNLFEKSLFLDTRSVLVGISSAIDFKYLLCLAAELAKHPYVVFSVKWL